MTALKRDTVVIIDYGSGNLRSAAKAFDRVISEENMNLEVIVSDRPEDLLTASRIVLPGQGAFGDCIDGLKSRYDLYETLQQQVQQKAVPFLGICVGMQLMASEGHEHGVHQGMDWVPGTVKKMTPLDPTLKIPHMGWNNISAEMLHPALRHIKSDDHFYFVHSFVVELEDKHHMYATCDYGGPFAAIIGTRNMIGTQFHVEKSHEAGLRLIKGFLEWTP